MRKTRWLTFIDISPKCPHSNRIPFRRRQKGGTRQLEEQKAPTSANRETIRCFQSNKKQADERHEALTQSAKVSWCGAFFEYTFPKKCSYGITASDSTNN